MSFASRRHGNTFMKIGQEFIEEISLLAASILFS